jgi:S1-C subfamily serine protease
MNEQGSKKLILMMIGILLSVLAIQVRATSSQEQALQSTLRIICVVKQDQTQLGTGSGFVVGDATYVATNAHVVSCVNEHGQVTILMTSGFVNATIVLTQQHKDLAILRAVKSLNLPAVGFATHKTVVVGDDAWVAGFPGAADDVASFDEILPELDKLKIHYEVDTLPANFITRLWLREPVIFVILVGLLLLKFLYRHRDKVANELSKYTRHEFKLGVIE